jgi:hypothetical protein
VIGDIIPMVQKKYMALRGGILMVNGGEIVIDIHSNTYGQQWFASQEQFDKQVESGLIVEVDSLPNEA